MYKFLLLFLILPVFCQEYPWKREFNGDKTIENSINLPEGYTIIHCSDFSKWLYNLPLKPKKSKVKLHNKKLKPRQDVHYRVIDIDTGKRDLQQCADAVMRLRAEYLYSKREYSKISFNYTSGDKIPFSKWINGYIPKVISNKVSWEKKTKPDSSYSAFKKYIKNIFIYSGSWSLSRELKKKSIDNICAGDVFIQGGFPGHAVLVCAAVQNSSGDRKFLLLQSYMPAQDIHILKNPYSSSPWYSVKEIKRKGMLVTPEWEFKLTDLKYF